MICRVSNGYIMNRYIIILILHLRTPRRCETVRGVPFGYPVDRNENITHRACQGFDGEVEFVAPEIVRV